jgi:hypothetical protein
MSSISKFRSSASTNRNQGGGNKLSGLPPSVGGNPFARNVWARKATVPFDKRNVVFCINQLGGIGRKSSMFLSTADGVRCVQQDDDTIVEDDASVEDDAIVSDDEVSDSLDPGPCTEVVSTLDSSNIIYSDSGAKYGRSVSITQFNTDLSYIAIVGRPGPSIEDDSAPPPVPLLPDEAMPVEGQSGVYLYTFYNTIDSYDMPEWKYNTQYVMPGENARNNLGFSVSSVANLNNNYCFIAGCPQNKSSETDISFNGEVNIFSCTLDNISNSTLDPPVKIYASDFKDNQGIVEDNSGALFGYSVALSNTINSSFAYAIIGEPMRNLIDDNDQIWPEAGAVYLAKLTINESNTVTYTPMYSSTDDCLSLSQITAGGCTTGLSDDASFARFGYSVEIDQNVPLDASFVYGIIGAPGNGSDTDTIGQVYIIKIDTSNDTWCLQKNDIINNAPEPGPYDEIDTSVQFGYSVAIRTVDETLYAGAGAPGTIYQTTSESESEWDTILKGTAYIFKKETNNNWMRAFDTSPACCGDINFGCTVAISDNYIFIGSDGNTNTFMFGPLGYIVDKGSIGYTEFTSHMSASRPYMAIAGDQLIVGYPSTEMVTDGTVQIYDLTGCVNNSYCGVGDCCKPGTYSDASYNYCIDCAEGGYNPDRGRDSECARCAAGTYQNASGSTSCIPCAAGTYSSASGWVTCTACSIGTYQDASGSTSCIDCGRNKYSLAGASSCCDTGSSADEGCNVYIQLAETPTLYLGKDSSDTNSINAILTTTPNIWLWHELALYNTEIGEGDDHKLYIKKFSSSPTEDIIIGTPDCDCANKGPCCNWSVPDGGIDDDGSIIALGTEAGTNRYMVVPSDVTDLCGTQLQAGPKDSAIRWNITVVEDT